MLSLAKDHWFAVQVLRQHEQRVASMLEAKGYEKFVPTYLARRNWSDRKKLVQQPLIPGYVFCRALEASVGLVRATQGVVRILGFGGQATPVPDEEIRALHQIIASGLDACPCNPLLRIGQRVQVRSGPLAGVVGTLVRIKTGNRLVMSVEITMKAFSVEIDAWEVESLGRPGGSLASTNDLAPSHQGQFQLPKAS